MLSALTVFVFIGLQTALPQQDLPEKYRNWLDQEVVYIISDQEKEIFSRLQTNSQRDRFIDEFWLERDPSPGSVKNEFREEHYRRIDFANKWFGRETGAAGWTTDRGRIYILLGAPASKEEFKGGLKLQPCELWSYQSDYSQGLPPNFYCIFFKKNGLWNYIQYDPAKHSPADLINSGAGDVPENAVSTLARTSPLLAKASVSLIPSENVDIGNYNGTVSLSSIRLIAALNNIPNFQRDYSYAERIYRGEGRVSTGYTFTAKTLPANFHVAKMESGYSLLNYAFHYPPELKLGKYGSSMYLSINIFFQVEDEKGQIVISHEEKLEREFSDVSAAQLSRQGLIYQGVNILLPGDYNVTLTVSNNVSKEFFSIGEKVSVPGYTAEKLELAPPLLFFVSRKDPAVGLSNYPPYTYSDIRFQPLLSTGIPQGQMLGVMYQVHDISTGENTRVTYELINSRGEVVNQHRVIVEKRNFNVNGTATVFWRLSTNELPEDQYFLELTANRGDSESRQKSQTFRVGREPLPEDIITLESKALNFLSSEPTIESIMQLFQQEKYEPAERMIRNARKKWPKEELLEDLFARALIKNQNYLEAKNILNTMLLRDAENYKARFQLGMLLLRTGKYQESIKELENVRVIEGDHPDILNPLGEAYQLSGDSGRAKALWQLSLQKDPTQVLLKKRLEEM